MVVSSFAIGLLGRGIWYMGAGDAMLTILFFNLISPLKLHENYQDRFPRYFR